MGQGASGQGWDGPLKARAVPGGLGQGRETSEYDRGSLRESFRGQGVRPLHLKTLFVSQ